MLSVSLSLRSYLGNLNVLAFIGGVFFIIISLGIFVTVVCFNGKRRNQCNSVSAASKKRGKWKRIESIIRSTLCSSVSGRPPGKKMKLKIEKLFLVGFILCVVGSHYFGRCHCRYIDRNGNEFGHTIGGWHGEQFQVSEGAIRRNRESRVHYREIDSSVNVVVVAAAAATHTSTANTIIVHRKDNYTIMSLEYRA